jgi:hypothetical protein
MSQIDTENDPFLALLTDALRAGPGSPQWREALAQLPTDGQDEYRKLIEARESLESGREYRSVRPGPGFTRKVMSGLEGSAPAATPKVRLATIIAALSALVILGLIGLAVYEFYPRTSHEDSAQALNELATTFLPTELSATNFDQTVVPSGWREIGSLPINTASGLKAGDATIPADDYAGGGIVLASSVPAEKPVAIQATIKVDKPGDDLIPQLFASTDPQFSSDRAISSQEVVWQLQGDKQKVVVNGRVSQESPLDSKNTHTIRLVLKGDLAVVESDGKRVWAGRSLLGDKARYLGVRFIRTGQTHGGDVTVQSLKVTTANS